jgi:transposase-like protein
MERRQRRSFTEEYRRQAVELVASSGRSIGSVANELGLRDSVLRRWVEKQAVGYKATTGRGAQRCKPHCHRQTRPRRSPACSGRTNDCVWSATF